MASAAPLFPITDPQLGAKGRRWVRALQRQVADAWQATLETDTRLTPERGLLAEAETIAIATAFAATAIRVLDLEVFNRQFGRSGRTYRSSPYERFRDGDDQGRVLTGLVVIRNAEIHLPVLIDPDLERAVGIPGSMPTRFRVFPRWVPYRRLAREMRHNITTGDRRRQALAYRSHVADRLVIETLLDALAYFLRCDPSLARRTADGELEGFPLPELVQHDPYERRHPQWPTRETVAAEVRAEVSAKPPAGLERVILHRLLDPSGGTEAFVGGTVTSPGAQEAFVERPAQVAADVAAGYCYTVGEGKVSIGVNGRLTVGGDPLDAVALPPPPASGPDGGLQRSQESWRALLRLADDDGFFYARQRAVR